MENLNAILQILENNDMHVHEIGDESNPYLKDTPLPWLARSTHYILRGDELMHVGNLTTIERFVLALNKEP